MQTYAFVSYRFYFILFLYAFMIGREEKYTFTNITICIYNLITILRIALYNQVNDPTKSKLLLSNVFAIEYPGLCRLPSPASSQKVDNFSHVLLKSDTRGASLLPSPRVASFLILTLQPRD